MNKSKFLKKSLAMLLALMLVVAMIPLSAAAAAPDVTQINVKVGNASVTLTGEDKALSGSIPNTAKEITLEVLTEPGAKVYYVDDVNNAASEEVALTEDKAVGDKWTATIDVTNFKQGETLNLGVHVYDASTLKDPDVYTVSLTRESVSTDTSIKSICLQTSDDPAVPQLGYTIADNNTLKITMPYSKVGNYTVKTLETNGTAEYADPNGKFGPLVLGTTPVENGGKIRISAGQHSTTYTLDITVASGFKSFGFDEDIDAVVFPGSGNIAVLLPFGYSTDEANVKTDVDGNKYIELTPDFELDYPSATATYDAYDKVYDAKTEMKNDQKIIVPVNSVYNRNEPNIASSQDVFTSVKDWTDRKNANLASDNWTGFIAGLNPRPVPAHGASTIEINYVEDTTRTYNVYFYEAEENDQAVIDELTIGSETATIDQDAKTIDITLPAGTNKGALDLTDEKTTKLTITASDNATITFPAQEKVKIEDATDTTTPPTSHTVWTTFTAETATEKLNASSQVILKVVSQDGSTTTNYKLNVTVSDNYQAPEITSMRLTNGDGEEQKVEFDEATNTYTFTVPYSVVAKGDLEGYKLYYNKTVGATATYNNGMAFPKTGMVLEGDEEFLPDPGKNQRGGAITVTANKAGSQEKDEYFIVINRAPAKTDSELDAFALTGSLEFDKVTSANTYPAESADLAKGKVTVNVPWSAYEQWKNNNPKEFGSTFTIDPSAKIYYLQSNVLYPLYAVVEDKDLGTPNPNPTSWEDSQDSRDVVVLSEDAWVNATVNKKVNATTGEIANWNSVKKSLKNYTQYPVEFEQAAAKEYANLSSLTLLDESGWTKSLDIDVVNDRISGEVPYSMTTAENTNLADATKIYLDYTVYDRAHVLSWDKGLKKGDTIINKGRPVTDAVFSDMGEVADYNDYDGAYLVLWRNDDVVGTNKNVVTVSVYDDKTSNKEIEASENRLLVVNEDGKQDFEGYTVELTYDEPNTEALFKSFAFKGYEKYPGQIDSKNHTITVTLPYGTEYTYLVPVYSTSDNAVVTVDDPKLTGKPLRSNVTSVNFTASRKFTVTAENEEHYTTYTVTVKVSDQFTDVNPDDWFYDNVMGAVANGYMTGNGDGTFNPMGKATRAQFACALANALGYEAAEGETIETPFIDVDEGDWYAGAVNFCYDNGIISGYEDATYRPNQTITRQEAAAMLNNAFDLEASSDVSMFTDAGRIASWATAHVGAVANAELMNGDAAGTFRPTGTLTRAELASIMMNALNHGFID